MKIRLRNLLSLTLIIISHSTLWSANDQPQFFLEKVTVPNTFEFYTVITNNGNKTLSRSEELDARTIRRAITNELLESDFIYDSNRKIDSLFYLKIELEQLTIFKKGRDSKYIHEAQVSGTLELTNYQGQVLFEKSLEEVIKGVLATKKAFQTGTPSWVFAFKEEFAIKLSVFIAEEITTFLEEVYTTNLNTRTVDQTATAIQLKNKIITDSTALAEMKNKTITPWDAENNQSIIGVLGENGLTTGLLLDRGGYFVCDLKSIPKDKALKVVDYYGDTIMAEIIRVDKRLELAIGLVQGGMTYNPRPMITEKLEVGNEIYFRGYSGIPYLPIICGKGKTTGKIENWGYSGYLFNSNYSDNMSGSPIYNDKGEVIGIAVGNSFSNKYKKPVFLCYSIADLYAVFNIQAASINLALAPINDPIE